MRREPGVSLLQPPVRQRTALQRYGPITGLGLLLGATIGLGLTQLPVGQVSAVTPARAIDCPRPHAIDGVILGCGGKNVHLAGVDASGKLGGTANLRSLIRGARVICRQAGRSGDGMATQCSARGKDLSCAQVEDGFAVRHGEALTC